MILDRANKTGRAQGVKYVVCGPGVCDTRGALHGAGAAQMRSCEGKAWEMKQRMTTILDDYYVEEFEGLCLILKRDVIEQCSMYHTSSVKRHISCRVPK